MLRSPNRGTWSKYLASQLLVAALLTVAAAPGLIAVAWLSGPDVVRPAVHGVVTAIVVVALGGLATKLTLAGWRRRDSRTLIGAFAIGLPGALLLTESLALLTHAPTDGLVVRVSGLLTIPAGAGVVLSARARSVVRPGRELVVLRTGLITVGVVAVLGVIGVAWPHGMAERIPAGSPFAASAFIVGTVALVVIAWSATRTALLTRRALDGVLTVGVVLLIPALAGMAYGLPGDARWGVAHVLQFIGAALMAVQLAVDVSRPHASRALTGGVSATALVERSADFLGARVTALVDRLLEKDPTTAGHVGRVAVLAVQMGEHLRLSTGQLRLLAAGGLLHDIGKLSVPTELLQKPAELSPEEFAVVQRHPSDGRMLLTELGGFHPTILELVELHHERVDGTGYPHGHQGDTLSLEVRILAVADVFDALTADRPYRRATSADDALAELDRQGDGGLDPHCIAALRAVIDGAQLADIERRSNRRPGDLATI